MNDATPAHFTDSSKMQPATVEIARNAYRDCLSRFDGTAAEFRAECLEIVSNSLKIEAVGYAGLAWAVAALSVVGDLGPEAPRNDESKQTVLRLYASQKNV